VVNNAVDCVFSYNKSTTTQAFIHSYHTVDIQRVLLAHHNIQKHMKTHENNKTQKNNKTQNIVTIDFGKNQAYYYDPAVDAKQSVKIALKDLLHLPKKYTNTLFVAESAHLDRPRTMKSFAQQYTIEELNAFKKACSDNNNVLKLFPEMLTHQVISNSGLEKSDENDPISLHQYLTKYPNIVATLKNPSVTYEADDVLKEGWAIKDNMNTLLNYARRNDYGKDDPNDFIRNWLEKHVDEICAGLSDEAKLVFGLDNVYKKDNAKKKVKKGAVNLNAANMTAIYSIAAALFEFSVTPELTVQYKPRLRERTQELPGWKFISKCVFGFSPYHLRGGLARSNLKFHNFKTYLSRKAEAAGFDMDKKKLNGKQKHEFDPNERSFFSKVQNHHKKACQELYLSIKHVVERRLLNKNIATYEMTTNVVEVAKHDVEQYW
jgi:hypothetical protein